MFRTKSPQASLFQTSNLLPGEKLARAQASWAWTFRLAGLPLIKEESFSDLYCADNGRPNRPVQMIIGILLFKEIWDLTDNEALEQLEWNLLWQMALNLTPEEAHLCQKTLHNFRVRLLAVDGGALLFKEITDAILKVLGIETSRQRVDSTHIISNIAILTRLGLICETIRVFLRDLKKNNPGKFRKIPKSIVGRYMKDDGADTFFEDARSSKARARLKVCSRDLWRLADLFIGDDEISGYQSYGLLQRLLKEQCDVRDDAPPPLNDDDDFNDKYAPIVPKKPKEVRSDSLQSPHDPDVTYSGHKGKGYEVQLAETCGNEGKPEIITHVEVTPSSGSDADATVPIVEQLKERGICPDEMIADTTYGSTSNMLECQENGVTLISPTPGKEVSVPAEGVLSESDFDIDLKGKRPSLCPAGHAAVTEGENENTGKITIVFSKEHCSTCGQKDNCPTRKGKYGDRVLHTTAKTVVLSQRRQYEQTEEFKKKYAIRAGIEASNSELKRKHGLSKLRVRGSPQVCLSVYLKVLACNMKRMIRYVMEVSPEIHIQRELSFVYG